MSLRVNPAAVCVSITPGHERLAQVRGEASSAGTSFVEGLHEGETYHGANGEWEASLCFERCKKGLLVHLWDFAASMQSISSFAFVSCSFFLASRRNMRCRSGPRQIFSCVFICVQGVRGGEPRPPLVTTLLLTTSKVCQTESQAN